MTAQQLFKAASEEALRSLHDVPVQKILNRISPDELVTIINALAQHFAVLVRHAAEGIDVTDPALSIGEHLERMQRARDVKGAWKHSPALARSGSSNGET